MSIKGVDNKKPNLGIKSEELDITRVRPHHFRIGAGPKQTTFTKITLNPNGILSEHYDQEREK